jgi:hypothetical protein
VAPVGSTSQDQGASEATPCGRNGRREAPITTGSLAFRASLVQEGKHAECGRSYVPVTTLVEGRNLVARRQSSLLVGRVRSGVRSSQFMVIEEGARPLLVTEGRCLETRRLHRGRAREHLAGLNISVRWLLSVASGPWIGSAMPLDLLARLPAGRGRGGLL